MKERATITFINYNEGFQTELDIPLDITASDLILALNETYQLKMDKENIFSCYLVSENPIAFLRGNKRLLDYGLRNGSRIIFKRS